MPNSKRFSWSTHYQQKNGSNVLIFVSIDLEGGKQYGCKDSWYESVDQIPNKRGKPIRTSLDTTYKLKVFSLGEEGEIIRQEVVLLTLVSLSWTRKITKLANRKLKPKTAVELIVKPKNSLWASEIYHQTTAGSYR